MSLMMIWDLDSSTEERDHRFYCTKENESEFHFTDSPCLPFPLLNCCAPWMDSLLITSTPL